MREWTVQDPAPARLDRYLLRQFPALGAARLERAWRDGRVKVNGSKRPLADPLKSGDSIRLYLSETQLGLQPASVVYEDAQLLIADKPAGIPVEGEGDSLLARATLNLGGVGADLRLCHRLDTGTSGLVLLAKNESAERFLTTAIRERQIGKHYLCVTLGHPQPPAAVLHGYLYKDAARGTVRILAAPQRGAKAITTGYETLAVSGALALLKVDLITGRTHQIRAHLASVGCPILGDSKYGDNAANRAYKFRYQALCAWELTMPEHIGDPAFAHLAGRVFHAAQPWYCRQLLDGRLK